MIEFRARAKGGKDKGYRMKAVIVWGLKTVLVNGRKTVDVRENYRDS